MRGALLSGRYRLGPVIGVGGTGSVHRARDELVGHDVAVKLLRPGAAATDCERLHREVEYLRCVQHPNLVAVLDAGTAGDDLGRGGSAWFAMELVAGPDLRTLLHDRGPLQGAAVRRLMTGVLGALGAMHAADLVHRDVTPPNILLTAGPFARWEAKLTDLGIAQRALAVPLTDTGRVVGTAAYLSPEQVTGGEVGPATDVYALALVALEALTGVTPFPGSAVESATARLLRSPALPAGLAPAWRELLTAALAVEPEDRPSADAMREAAAALPDDAGVQPDRAVRAPRDAETTAQATAVLPSVVTAVHAVPAVPPDRRRRGRIGVLVGAGALLLVAVAATGSLALGQLQRTGSTEASDVVAGATASPTPAAARPTSSAAPVTSGDAAAAVGPASPPEPAAGPGSAGVGPGAPAAPGPEQGPAPGGPAAAPGGPASGPGAPSAQG